MQAKNDMDYYKYLQIGLELAAGVGLGLWAGYRLDARFGSAPWLMLAGAAAGLGAGFYLVLRELPAEKDYKSGKKGPGEVP
ncbi:MAG: AtpZ/AtpI family protein [Elusimicrobiales bacterium]|jgi:F0F1-type ATP synthase assembly protein I